MKPSKVKTLKPLRTLKTLIYPQTLIPTNPQYPQKHSKLFDWLAVTWVCVWFLNECLINYCTSILYGLKNKTKTDQYLTMFQKPGTNSHDHSIHNNHIFKLTKPSKTNLKTLKNPSKTHFKTLKNPQIFNNPPNPSNTFKPASQETLKTLKNALTIWLVGGNVSLCLVTERVPNI